MEDDLKPKSKDLRKRIMSKVKELPPGSIDHPLPNEHWNPLLFACSLGDLTCVKYIVEDKDADTARVPEGKISPKMTPVHMSGMFNNVNVVQCVISPTNVNMQDQWGFTALHYAAVHRCTDVVELLLRHGADTSLTSASGNTALDLAQTLNFTDIADTLASSMQMKEDPNAPQFRKWLRSIGAGAYISSFFKAGYDLAFIAKEGLTAADMDCIGIPKEQLGVRRKLETLHNIAEFFDNEEDNNDDDDDLPDDDDDDDSEDGSDEDSDAS